MQTSIQPNDILNTIEFELMQGIVFGDDLGEGIQVAQKYQNQIRSELLDAQNRDISLQDALDRQLQINDLLLSLVERTNLKLHKLQLELHHSTSINLNLVTKEEGQNLTHSEPPTSALPNLRPDQGVVLNQVHNLSQTEQNGSDLPSELLSMIQNHSLQIKPDVRVIQTPFVGKFLTRLRIAFHNLVLFYVNRLATQQTKVNHVYGEELKNLHNSQTRLLEKVEHLHN